MSATPRTDAVHAELSRYKRNTGGDARTALNHARALERELAASMSYAERNLWAASRLVNLAGRAFDLLDADEDMKCLKLLKAMGGGSPGYRADIDEIHAALAKNPAPAEHKVFDSVLNPQPQVSCVEQLRAALQLVDDYYTLKPIHMNLANVMSEVRAALADKDAPKMNSFQCCGASDPPCASFEVSCKNPTNYPTTKENAMSTSIKPTIGRVVHFYQSATFPEPRAAIICYVHNDSMVNLTVFNGNGESSGVTSVPLRQAGDEVPNGFRCEWMPYQIGQAAKTEQAEARVAALEGDRA